MSVSIILPSYKRSRDLQRCLNALKSQEYDKFEALVVCRPDDTDTRACLIKFSASDSRFREVLVNVPGVIAALNIGFRQASGEFVTFTDDDAEAPSHWLSSIVAHFESYPKCGGVGGRDCIQLEIESLRNPPPTRNVGRDSWTGIVYGNHHCPIKEPFLRVEMLKGVNMTFRHEIIRGLQIGDGLRGEGTTVGWEASLANRVLKQRYQLHFVRDAWLKHHIAPRNQNDDRTEFTSEFALNTTYNNNYIAARYKGIHMWGMSMIRAVLIGSSKIPGLVRAFTVKGFPSLLFLHMPHMIQGGIDGLRARRANR